METVLESPGKASDQYEAKIDVRLRRLYSSIVAVFLGGIMWTAFYSIATYQIDWEGLPSTVTIPLVVSLIGSLVFVVGVIISLLLVSRLVKQS